MPLRPACWSIRSNLRSSLADAPCDARSLLLSQNLRHAETAVLHRGRLVEGLLLGEARGARRRRGTRWSVARRGWSARCPASRRGTRWRPSRGSPRAGRHRDPVLRPSAAAGPAERAARRPPASAGCESPPSVVGGMFSRPVTSPARPVTRPSSASILGGRGIPGGASAGAVPTLADRTNDPNPSISSYRRLLPWPSAVRVICRKRACWNNSVRLTAAVPDSPVKRGNDVVRLASGPAGPSGLPRRRRYRAGPHRRRHPGHGYRRARHRACGGRHRRRPPLRAGSPIRSSPQPRWCRASGWSRFDPIQE